MAAHIWACTVPGLDRIGLRQPRAVQTLREAASAPPDHPRWPVFLVLHGGGFREGDPTLYGFLADQYLERGIAFASVGYRLSPECSLPETFLDVENAVGWCIANLPSRGIDVARLALSGHSAGAIVTARLATRDNWQAPHGVPSDVIKAAVPVSGVYDFMDASERQELFRTVRTASRRARS
jgi:acetyl esterase/lipase